MCGLAMGCLPPYIQKVNRGTIKRTGSDRVCRSQTKDSRKGGNLVLEVGEDWCRETQWDHSGSQRGA